MLRHPGCMHGRQTAQPGTRPAFASRRPTVAAAAQRTQHSWRDAQRYTPPASDASASSTSASSASWLDRARTVAGASAAAALLTLAPMLPAPGPLVPSAAAADAAKVGSCLLQNCQKEFAQCIGDANCLQNLACLNACALSDDESACQIRCGDRFEDKAVTVFNACAVSEKKCVPQRVDKDVYPVPPECSLDTAFDLSKFTGRWYITAGLNPLFDLFDCQVHFFVVPSPGNLVGKINWRINKPEGDFIERSTTQSFKQDPNNAAMLYNHGNEYLHYQDDWYILASKPNEYVMIYYRGTNDAWDGYGGATVYTRKPKLPKEYIPELSAAAERAGLVWNDFKETDNSCKPHPPNAIQVVEEDVESSLTSFGKGFTVLKNSVANVVPKGERFVEQEVKDAESALLALEREFVEELEGEGQQFGRQIGSFFKSLKGVFAGSPKQTS